MILSPPKRTWGLKMTKEICTTIERIEAAPQQRLLVVSDIHGHFNCLSRLLQKMEYGGEDILILVGDLIEKGPESLRVVQYVMELCRQRLVYVSMGNVDWSRVSLILDDSEETAKTFVRYLRAAQGDWGSSLGQEMLAALGASVDQVTEENAQEYRRKIREHFRRELTFLKNCPTILTAGHYLFVHGGVTTDHLSDLEGESAIPCLKTDEFWNQGYRFHKYTVVTGHWPTCLYRQEGEDVSPLFDGERKILCIDGGCGVKRAGQLNGIILPDCMADMSEIEWTCYDEFPLVRALASQKEKPATLHIRYFDNQIEPCKEPEEQGAAGEPEEEQGVIGETAEYRHTASGEIVSLPRQWIYNREDGTLHCEDYCNAQLAVREGDVLSVIFETSEGRYVKKRGQIGWYYGAAEPVGQELKLMRGRPDGQCFRRERELAVYELLDKLGIVFDRVDHSEANTMEACRAVNEALNSDAPERHVVICKNLFLCNQQRTKFYLLMMPEDKKFITKDLSAQIQSARLSFGEAVYMERFLRVTPGSVSVMGLMNDRDNQVQLLIDRSILQGELFGCHPCMNTSSIRIRFSDLLEKFLPAVHHEPLFVEL